MRLNKDIVNLLSRRPLVVLSCDDSLSAGIRESRNGVNRFTLTQRHWAIEGLKAPTLCVAELRLNDDERECYVGVLSRKATVSTFDARLTFLKLRPISFRSLGEIAPKLKKSGYERRLKERIRHGTISLMSEKLGVDLMETIAVRNARQVEAAFGDLPDKSVLKGAAWEQKDAIKVAQTVFGLSASDRANDENQDSGDEVCDDSAHLLEDNVINIDASEVPGFSLIEKHLTGRSDFRKGDERLTIYTANRGPLEEMLGVDLIYINEVVGNTVMVQYKMLKSRDRESEQDWTFHLDPKLASQIDRMKMPSPKSERFDDYRLHRNPFFFKFVKRRLVAAGEQQAFVIALPHLQQLIDNPKMRGPKGGIRVSYQSLAGNYLRQSDLIGLIRSGYVGTHRVESNSIRPFVEALNRGERGAVVAWQRKMKNS